jgi:Protein chain release factor A
MKRIIEIRAGEGGDDAKLFVAELALAYLKFSAAHG